MATYFYYLYIYSSQVKITNVNEAKIKTTNVDFIRNVRLIKVSFKPKLEAKKFHPQKNKQIINERKITVSRSTYKLETC